MGLIESLCTKSWLEHLLYVGKFNMFFNNTRAVTPMQVIFRGTHWIRIWVLLQKEDEQPHIIRGCRVLEQPMEIFASNGCSFSNKITFM
jgi:hypothetical protein